MATQIQDRAAPNGPDRGTFSTSGWSEQRTASLEARGPDLAAALEAGLRAILALGANAPASWPPRDRSTPLRGEGIDEATLFADLVDDLFDQIALFGASIESVQIDGVLRRDGGGYVAWGYAGGPLVYTPVFSLMSLEGPVSFARDGRGDLILAATLRRT